MTFFDMIQKASIGVGVILGLVFLLHFFGIQGNILKFNAIILGVIVWFIANSLPIVAFVFLIRKVLELINDSMDFIKETRRNGREIIRALS